MNSRMPEDGEQQPNDAGRKSLEKTVKILGGVNVSVPVPLFLAGLANKNKSGGGGGELILFQASVALALFSFFAGLALLISVQCKNVKMSILLGLLIAAVFSVLAGVVVLAISVFI
ncbi:hypothetical protein M5K25_008933 [Dendrobium thyrsiflorum]|uniref:Uncharacterized protein n=1 Tax=Dendrobium thyrsiflorum TaxID=117978 RepID=A0ABD0VGR1_DENTH